MAEAGVHHELYRHLANAVEKEPNRGGRTYNRIEPEYGQDIRGFADLVLFDDEDNPILVIEAKRPDGESASQDVDPYAQPVIQQAFDYAAEMGAPYFATYNGDRFVLFRTFEEGRQLLQRSTKTYRVSSVEKFAESILDQIAQLEEGQEKWDSLDEAFIERIRSLHELLTPKLEAALTEQIEIDEAFYESFTEWAATQGIDYPEADEEEQLEIRERFAEQAAYLLVNKILFYKILEQSSAYSEDIRPLAVSIHRVRQDLQDHFQEVVDQIDFEAIFEHDNVYSEIALDRVGERIRDFILELDDEDLTRFDSDVIGRIYEEVIPPDRRHDLGEYYTPPAICDLITRLTVTDAHDTVLDPACGSGGFLVSAYQRKKDLLPESAGAHEQILSELYGVDINRFPAHLTAINLAIQDLSAKTENVNVEVDDFFEVTPDTMRFGRERADASGSEAESGVVEDTIGDLDAVVGNPPYIRQENIDEKVRVRNHLSRVDGEGLSRRSDIYSYFVTHGTEFLRDGGRLGFITSDRWLDTKYGADLQGFLLETYQIDAIIKFDAQAFEDALVGSSVIILEKTQDKTARDQNIVKFLRVKGAVEIDDIASLVSNTTEPEQLIRTDKYRLVTRTQRDLQNEDKWSLFFTAPPIYFEALANADTVELDNVASLSYGQKTGANDFFCHRSDESVDLGIESYTAPLLKASGQLNRISFEGDVAREWEILDIHDIVVEAREAVGSTFEDNLEANVKQWLAENGHEILVEFIEWGEDQGYDERSTCASREIWFDLGDLPRPPLIMPEFIWREFRVVWNEANGVGTNQFYNIDPADGVDSRLLCGLLNSRLTWMNAELRGRKAGGQGLTRARMMVYETEQLPLPDPDQMSDEERNQIKDSLDDLIERENELDEDASVEETESERDDLDTAVLAMMGMEDELGRLKAAVDGLVAMREKEAGERTEVLVDRPDEREVIDLAGVSQVRESTTLDDFG